MDVVIRSQKPQTWTYQFQTGRRLLGDWEPPMAPKGCVLPTLVLVHNLFIFFTGQCVLRIDGLGKTHLCSVSLLLRNPRDGSYSPNRCLVVFSLRFISLQLLDYATSPTGQT